jgi:putative peptidoglycan lipid II flippase
MVRRILRTIANPVRGLHEAAYVLALFALLSQLLALVRDRLLAGTFGASGTLDVYYAAFRVPDFLFATVASLLSLYALMPVLARLEAEDAGKMVAFLRRALLLFFVSMGVIAAACFVLAPWLVRLTAPGIAADPALAAELVALARVLLLQPIFLGASNILANLTQMRHRFVLYSISPLLYNLGIIAGILWLYPLFGIAGLGWGVVLGALLHFLVQVPYFARERAGRLDIRESARGFREVLMLSVPRTLALASTQVTLLVLTALASWFAAGSISVFTFAYNLQAVPIAIIGVSYSLAAFPTLARYHAEGKLDELARYVESALRHLLFWSVPATALVIVLRAQLVRVILGSGAFDWEATRLTAAALALFVLSLAAQNATLLIARTYYAAGNSRKPFYFGLIDVVVSVGAALLLAGLFHTSADWRLFVESLLRVDSIPGTTVLMLALGFALGSAAEAVVGYRYFVRDFRVPQARLGRLAFQSLGASVIGAAAAYGVLALFGSLAASTQALGVFLHGLAAGVAGIIAIVLVLAFLRNEELAEAWTALHRRLSPGARLALEATDVES